jgi:hypothetical protein
MCLYYFVSEAAKRKRRKKFPALHIVIEAGHRNVGDVERIFLEVKNDLEQTGCDILRTLTMATKDDCDPLMIADFVAHSTFMLDVNARDGRFPNTRQRAQPGHAGITHFQSTPEALETMRAVTIATVSPSKKGQPS